MVASLAQIIKQPWRKQSNNHGANNQIIMTQTNQKGKNVGNLLSALLG
jgi:hypothetical protein